MTVHIYNSLTKQKEKLLPFEGRTIKMYCCGPTVYDQCHIGHARSLYIFDVIRRYLKYRGYDVLFIRNITDVDDKIIHKAKESGKTFEQVVEENIKSYHKDLKSLGIEAADKEPRATENIADMIKHIQGLIEKGYAYEVDGDVYFNVRKFKDYGKLSGQSIEQMQEAVRIEQDLKKKDPLDFALWKKNQEKEKSWPSPWGEGRPGWHIECSCMSMKYLKSETLDIHAGGRDLIFPHHENEIAQSEALTEKPFAQYWIHHGLLTIDGQKMAKSLGNFITIQEAIKKYGIDELKFFFLSSHYASPIDFGEGRMEEAHKALARIRILVKKGESITVTKSFKEESIECSLNLREYRDKIIEAMDDDFNTPKAFGVLFDLVTETNKFIDTDSRSSQYSRIVDEVIFFLKDFLKDIFGILLDSPVGILPEDLEKLLMEREEARKNKKFEHADKIRALLNEKGIIVEDTKDGQSWRRA